MSDSDRFNVLIVGGGIAGLEAAFALEAIAGARVDSVLLTAQERFSYRPLAVLDAFSRTVVPDLSVHELAQRAGATVVRDTFRWAEPEHKIIHTGSGEIMRYDALLLAAGARRYAQFPFVTTIGPEGLRAQVQSLLREAEHGAVKRIAFLIPDGQSWPLPIYEFALLLSTAARERDIELELTIVTADERPLIAFGAPVSDAVSALLDAGAIAFLGGRPAQVHTPHWVSRTGSPTRIAADRIIALAELCAPPLPGIPTHAARGFVSVDRNCRVLGLTDVFAAGDVTARALKHGGLAAQQADTAAAQIAALAGVTGIPEPEIEVAHAVLDGGAHPLFIRAEMVAGTVTRSEASRRPLWDRPEKLHARYLGPALAALTTTPKSNARLTQPRR